MKKKLFFMLGVCAALAMTSCKSKESAWMQAYNKASQNATPTDTMVNDDARIVEVVPVAPPSTTNNSNYNAKNDSDVRTIDGPLSVVSGSSLKNFSVVVGSFVTQTNALGLKERLVRAGYDARVVKTNETINGHTGWFRVIASSFADKNSALQSRNQLKSQYAGAWLLYTK